MLCVRGEDNFGVRPGPKRIIAEPRLQLAEVVDLTVEDDGVSVVRIELWLVRGLGKVDDREPPVAESDPVTHEKAIGIRPAMRDPRRHSLDSLPRRIRFC